QQFTNFHLNQFQQVFIVDHIGLVQCDQQGWNTNLLGQQNVFTCLCHWAIGSSNNKNRAVHLCGTGNHVLDVVSVAWGVNVSVVTLVGLVLNVRNVNGNTALALFWCTIDVGVVALFVELWELIGKNLGDRSGQGSFTMVNVTDG